MSLAQCTRPQVHSERSHNVQLLITLSVASICTVRNNRPRMRFMHCFCVHGRAGCIHDAPIHPRFANVLRPLRLFILLAAPAQPARTRLPRHRGIQLLYPGGGDTPRPTASSQIHLIAAMTSTPQSEKRLRRGVDRRATHTVADRVVRSHDSPLARYGFHSRSQRCGFRAVDERLQRLPQHYFPQVLAAKVLTNRTPHAGHDACTSAHVVTVVMDTTYDIVYSRLDALHGYSSSRTRRFPRSTRPACHRTRTDHQQEHGFLWRLNTY